MLRSSCNSHHSRRRRSYFAKQTARGTVRAFVYSTGVAATSLRHAGTNREFVTEHVGKLRPAGRALCNCRRGAKREDRAAGETCARDQAGQVDVEVGSTMAPEGQRAAGNQSAEGTRQSGEA